MGKEIWRNVSNLTKLAQNKSYTQIVIFPRKYFDALKNLTGDHGGGFLLKNGVVPLSEIIKLPAEREFELWDVDSEESLAKVEQLMHLS